jgi:transcriptional regulator GlxA family with amidase domain
MRLIDLDVSCKVGRAERKGGSSESAHGHTVEVTAKLLAHPRLLRLVRHLEHHTSRRLTTAAAARVVCFQENYFCALFKRETGCTFVSWQRTWRVTRIADVLLSENISISQAAERYGYVSMRTFERAFKGVYHVSAREFRRVRREHTADP